MTTRYFQATADDGRHTMTSQRPRLSAQARAFADACHTNAIDELRSALTDERADALDIATWNISPAEWRLAIQTALAEREAGTGGGR